MTDDSIERMAKQFNITVDEMNSISTILDTMLEGRPVSQAASAITEYVMREQPGLSMSIAISFMAGLLTGQIIYGKRR